MDSYIDINYDKNNNYKLVIYYNGEAHGFIVDDIDVAAKLIKNMYYHRCINFYLDTHGIGIMLGDALINVGINYKPLNIECHNLIQ